jgi:hypothetical protein
MSRKLLPLVCLSAFSIMLFFVGLSSEFSVGMKEGDWIEYKITLKGAVPKEHNVEWARFDVLAIEGKIIEVNITLRFTTRAQDMLTSTLNLEIGRIGDAFIIPANLNNGDAFPDQYEDTITISGVEEKTYAGAKRTVVYAKTIHTKYYWDKSTGGLVEAISTYSNFNLNTKVDKTKM